MTSFTDLLAAVKNLEHSIAELSNDYSRTKDELAAALLRERTVIDENHALKGITFKDGKCVWRNEQR